MHSSSSNDSSSYNACSRSKPLITISNKIQQAQLNNTFAEIKREAIWYQVRIEKIVLSGVQIELENAYNKCKITGNNTLSNPLVTISFKLSIIETMSEKMSEYIEIL